MDGTGVILPLLSFHIILLLHFFFFTFWWNSLISRRGGIDCESLNLCFFLTPFTIFLLNLHLLFRVNPLQLRQSPAQANWLTFIPAPYTVYQTYIRD